MPRRKCQRTGKRIYRDEAEAKAALTRIHRVGSKSPDGSIPVRYYECPYCHLIHLTSKESGHDAPLPEIPDPTPPATMSPLESAEFDRDALERVVRKCIADGCGCCMHNPEWGAFLIRHGTTGEKQPPTTNHQRKATP